MDSWTYGLTGSLTLTDSQTHGLTDSRTDELIRDKLLPPGKIPQIVIQNRPVCDSRCAPTIKNTHIANNTTSVLTIDALN